MRVGNKEIVDYIYIYIYIYKWFFDEFLTIVFIFILILLGFFFFLQYFGHFVALCIAALAHCISHCSKLKWVGNKESVDNIYIYIYIYI